MKRLITAALLALSSTVFAATLNPVQLLNPAGSTAGQAIVSTGASTPPAWGAVPLTGITGTLAIANGGTGATSAANARTNLGVAALTGAAFTGVVSVTDSANSTPTLLLSNTGSLGSTIKLVGNGATTPSKTLKVVNGSFRITNDAASANLLTVDDSGNSVFTGNVTGQVGTFSTVSATTLNASGGTLGSVGISGSTITSTPISGSSASFTTLSATGLITPASAIGIKATATNDSAQAGSVGESTSNSTSGTSLTTGVTVNATSLPLAAGNWMVQCSARFNPAASTVLSTVFTSVTTVSATNGALGASTQIVNSGFVNGQQQIINSPVVNIKLASPGTVYCPSYAGFTTSTMTVDGVINAWRPR